MGCLDNCLNNPNPTQTDLNGNGIGDACENVCANVTSVVVTPGSKMVTVGESTQFTATVTPNCPTITWTSSDPTIATVDSTGKATGIKPGTVTITATSGGKSGTATLTVVAGNACGVVATFTSTFSLTIPLEARDNDPISNRGDHSEPMTVRVYDGTTKIYERTGDTSAIGLLSGLSDPVFKTCTNYTLLAKTNMHIAGILRNFQLSPTLPNSFTLPPLLFGDTAGTPNTNPLMNWGALGDCVVNAADISELYLFWGKKTNHRTDGDDNGETGAEDFSVMRKNLNQTCPVPQ